MVVCQSKKKNKKNGCDCFSFPVSEGGRDGDEGGDR